MKNASTELPTDMPHINIMPLQTAWVVAAEVVGQSRVATSIFSSKSYKKVIEHTLFLVLGKFGIKVLNTSTQPSTLATQAQKRLCSLP